MFLVSNIPGNCANIFRYLILPLTIWGMKEPDYVMKIMATGGALVSENHTAEADLCGRADPGELCPAALWCVCVRAVLVREYFCS